MGGGLSFFIAFTSRYVQVLGQRVELNHRRSVPSIF